MPPMASHIWADRFDRDLADIFVVQDEVVGKIVSALAGVLPAPTRPQNEGRQISKPTICSFAGDRW